MKVDLYILKEKKYIYTTTPTTIESVRGIVVSIAVSIYALLCKSLLMHIPSENMHFHTSTLTPLCRLSCYRCITIETAIACYILTTIKTTIGGDRHGF